MAEQQQTEGRSSAFVAAALASYLPATGVSQDLAPDAIVALANAEVANRLDRVVIPVLADILVRAAQHVCEAEELSKPENMNSPEWWREFCLRRLPPQHVVWQALAEQADAATYPALPEGDIFRAYAVYILSALCMPRAIADGGDVVVAVEGGEQQDPTAPFGIEEVVTRKEAVGICAVAYAGAMDESAPFGADFVRLVLTPLLTRVEKAREFLPSLLRREWRDRPSAVARSIEFRTIGARATTPPVASSSASVVARGEGGGSGEPKPASPFVKYGVAAGYVV
jgi:hypothetical protein